VQDFDSDIWSSNSHGGDKLYVPLERLNHVRSVI